MTYFGSSLIVIDLNFILIFGLIIVVFAVVFGVIIRKSSKSTVRSTSSLLYLLGALLCSLALFLTRPINPPAGINPNYYGLRQNLNSFMGIVFFCILFALMMFVDLKSQRNPSLTEWRLFSALIWILTIIIFLVFLTDNLVGSG